MNLSLFIYKASIYWVKDRVWKTIWMTIVSEIWNHINKVD